MGLYNVTIGHKNYYRTRIQVKHQIYILCLKMEYHSLFHLGLHIKEMPDVQFYYFDQYHFHKIRTPKEWVP